MLQLRESNPYILRGNNFATVSNADTKFILIPLLFLLLRVWTMILVILLVYAHISPPRILSFVLLYAAVSFDWLGELTCHLYASMLVQGVTWLLLSRAQNHYIALYCT